MITFLFVCVLLLTVVGQLLLWAACLKLGLRWMNVSDRSWRRVILASLLESLLQISAALLFLVGYRVEDRFVNLVMYLALTVWLGGTVAMIRWMFRTRTSRAVVAWLTTLLASSVASAVVYLVVKPYCFEAHKVPTNSMAPTIIGTHCLGTCPQCGQPAIYSANHLLDRYEDPVLMICQAHFHVSEVKDLSQQKIGGDRIIAAKFLRPRRWDLITFRLPEEPSVMYVKRLIGLPGETIIIKEGQIFADGQPLIPPDSIRELKYQSHNQDEALWGSEQKPAKLGSDEYFVLGDFPERSADSRAWQEGAPGHAPYAVPAENLSGVVTHTYWPPNRWRIFR
jgi:signal peptidase I